MTWPWQDPARPFAEVLVRRARPEFVRQVIVGGRSVLTDGRFSEVNRASILDEIAAELTREPGAQDQARWNLSEELLPHVARFYRGWL